MHILSHLVNFAGSSFMAEKRGLNPNLLRSKKVAGKKVVAKEVEVAPTETTIIEVQESDQPLVLLTEEEANALVLEHKGWAESIARSVARAWNLDWQMDGLDGAALEALIFCSRRFHPARGIPFRGYARKRIHEASTEAARKSKGWVRSLASAGAQERLARQVSLDLINVFPELRRGELPGDEFGEATDPRAAIRQLLVSAAVLASHQISDSAQPDEVADHLKVIRLMDKIDDVHQELMWQVYWEGSSLRSLAEEWETDELNVIREHKALLAFLFKSLEKGRGGPPLKVRPGLRDQKDRVPHPGRFTKLVSSSL